MKQKKVVYHSGDTIKIINPEFFCRVGYVLCLSDGINELEEKYGAKLNQFLKDIGLITNPDFKLDTSLWVNAGQFEKLEKELAYLIIKSKGFGCNKRQIFTKEIPSYRFSTFDVTDKKVVKTGQREVGGSEDQNYLSNEKSHVILTLNEYCMVTNDYLRIEEKNIELIKRFNA